MVLSALSPKMPVSESTKQAVDGGEERGWTGAVLLHVVSISEIKAKNP